VQPDPIGLVRSQIDRSEINLSWSEPPNELAMHASKLPLAASFRLGTAPSR